MGKSENSANKICGIYTITNRINGKKYVGQSVDIKNRWRHHKEMLRNQRHSNIYLQRSANKYGIENLEFEVVEVCVPSMLDDKEIKWIEKLCTRIPQGYNILGGGEGVYGFGLPDETYDKFRVPVLCLNTMEKYPSLRVAAESIGAHHGSIYACCSGRCSYVSDDAGNKLVFVYAGEYEQAENKRAYTESKMNRLRNVENREYMKKNSVVCLNNGMIFDSQKEAAAYAGLSHSGSSAIGSCAKGGSMSAGKDENGMPLVWRTLADYETMTKESIECAIGMAVQGRKGLGSANCKKVICINTGMLYPSVDVAAEKTGLGNTHIAANCRGRYKYIGIDMSTGLGLVFMFYDDYLKIGGMSEIESIRHIIDANKKQLRRNKPVLCINTNCWYQSANLAERVTGVSAACISNVCNGKQESTMDKTTGIQLKWKLAEPVDFLTAIRKFF